ncbi:MAG: ELM1/GtrOC1 family putative glycosyltransferase [Rickettsiales bacterium]
MNERTPDAKAPPSILALFDGRPGNDAQTQGVAEALGVPYVRTPVAFRSRVERFFDCGNGAYLADACKNLLHDLPKPDIILSTGGRAAYAARYMVRHIAPNAFRVNVMTPGLWIFKPEMCVIPMHDSGFFFAPNAFYTVGAPNDVARNVPSLEATERFFRQLNVAPNHKLFGVCVGGAVKGKAPSQSDVAVFIAELKHALVKNAAAPLFTFSRRTPAFMTEALRDAFPHAYHSDDVRMVYAASDVLCVTGDSVNMCSEACSTGKCVLIALFPSVMRKKHVAFVELLTRRKYARLLADRAPEDDAAPTPILTDADDAAQEIWRRFREASRFLRMPA